MRWTLLTAVLGAILGSAAAGTPSRDRHGLLSCATQGRQLVGVRLLMSGFQLMAIGGAAGAVANAMDDAVGG